MSACIFERHVDVVLSLENYNVCYHAKFYFSMITYKVLFIYSFIVFLQEGRVSRSRASPLLLVLQVLPLLLPSPSSCA